MTQKVAYRGYIEVYDDCSALLQRPEKRIATVLAGVACEKPSRS
jgi:hypothetical protein